MLERPDLFFFFFLPETVFQGMRRRPLGSKSRFLELPTLPAVFLSPILASIPFPCFSPVPEKGTFRVSVPAALKGLDILLPKSGFLLRAPM